jgi:hypothetical protein
MMSTFEEPPEKKQCTSYELCLFCQDKTPDPLVDITHVNFKCSSYDTFLSNLHKRAQLGNLNFAPASKRLHGVSSEVLKAKKATWHKKCYKLVTHRDHIKRDEESYRKSCAAKKNISNLTNRKRGRPSVSQQQETPTTSASTVTRSRSQATSFLREKCFFCQNDTADVLQPCSSGVRGKQITEIVQNSNNTTWKIQLGDVIASGDLLARDIMYYHICYTQNREKFVQRPQRKGSKGSTMSFQVNQEENLKFIAAEVEFMSIMQERIDDGEFIPMTEVQQLYKDIFQNHQIPGFDPNERLYLKQKLQNSLKNVNITAPSGRKASVVHSSDAGAAAIRAAAAEQRDIHGTLKVLYRSGRIIRNAVKQARQNPWNFE